MWNPGQVDGAIQRGEEWLENNKQTFLSETDTGIQFKDNFADLLILELSKRWDYVDLRIPEYRWNYFAIKPVIVPPDYPNDNDTNAVAFSILRPTEARAKIFIDEILACKDADGIVQVHLDPNRPRKAPEVTANILSLFYLYNRGHEVQESLAYLEKALALDEYEESRYYFLPEPLFFYTWRFLCIASGSKGLETIDMKRLPRGLHTLRRHLIRRVKDRIGAERENGLCPAIRLLICQSLGIENEADVGILLDLQKSDGCFGKAWYVRYGSNGIRISHEGFAVVIGVVALQRLRRQMQANGVKGGTGLGGHLQQIRQWLPPF